MEKELRLAYNRIEDPGHRSRGNNFLFLNIPEGVESNLFDCLEFWGEFLTNFVDVNVDSQVERAHHDRIKLCLIV